VPSTAVFVAFFFADKVSSVCVFLAFFDEAVESLPFVAEEERFLRLVEDDGVDFSPAACAAFRAFKDLLFPETVGEEFDSVPLLFVASSVTSPPKIVL
jgi:hypothetical protein